MPVIILGGILGGIVTPTEAASLAVAYALFIGTFVYRTLTLKGFYGMLVRTARITGGDLCHHRLCRHPWLVDEL